MRLWKRVKFAPSGRLQKRFLKWVDSIAEICNRSIQRKSLMAMKKFVLISAGLSLLMSVAVSLSAQELIPFRKGNLWGYADDQGKIVIEPRFERTWFFTGDDVARVRQKGLYGYIDRSGKFVVPAKYKEAGDFELGIAAVREGNRQFCINLEGNPDECNESYEDEPYEEDLEEAFVTYTDSTGLAGLFIEMTGDTIPEKFNSVVTVSRYFSPQQYQFALVSREGKWGAYNEQGRIIAPVEFEEVEPLSISSCKVKKDGLWGVLSRGSKMIIPCAYDSITKFTSIQTENSGLVRDEFFIVTAKSKSGLFNKTGQIILPVEFDMIVMPTPCNCAIDFVVRKENRYGIVDREGKFILPLKYTYAEPFTG